MAYYDMQRVAIIHGKAYDLESFAPHHPGGPIIHYGTGKPRVNKYFKNSDALVSVVNVLFFVGL